MLQTNVTPRDLPNSGLGDPLDRVTEGDERKIALARWAVEFFPIGNRVRNSAERVLNAYFGGRKLPGSAGATDVDDVPGAEDV